ncbi:MAG: hypothetical protein C5B59_16950 [Bacteroidetes bacterium]|nr:MAG: hypothetical protein C5B59_16950 [Bacteroidota bacterium]
MLAHSGQKRQLNTMLVVIVVSILLEQFVIAKIIPESSQLLGVNPIPVVLGVPVNLAINIGIVPILISFVSCFTILFIVNDVLQKNGMRDFWVKKIKTVFAGFVFILFYMLLAGLLYHVLKDHLPRALRNAFESFGINMDVYTFFPGCEIIHLRGSFFLLVAFIIGVYVFIRKIQRPSLEVSQQDEK